jgi:hypothetical protein
LPLPDGQVHHDTHAIPIGNYVIAVGNYVIVTRSQVGNYVIADIPAAASLTVAELDRLEAASPARAAAGRWDVTG